MSRALSAHHQEIELY